ncbi:MAG: hypothetical protein QXZ70_08855 [Candidatus Bathyarchaeia archaeon]
MPLKHIKVILVAALIFVVAYASASEVGISQLGFVGSSLASVPSGYQVKVKFIVERSADSGMIYVSGVELKFDREVASGASIYVNLLDQGGEVVAYADYTTDVQSNKFTIPLTRVINGGKGVAPESVASVTVTLSES